jgi:hypothetical protein
VSKGLFAGIITGVTVLGLVAPAAAQAPGSADAEQLRVRRRVSTMESVLESAVRDGAHNLLRQVELVSPDLPTLTGPPQVRGFRLAENGLFFFDVGVPGLRPPISWQLRTMGPDPFSGPAAAQMRALVERLNVEIGALERVVDGRSLGNVQLLVKQLTDLERIGRPTPMPRGGQQFVNAANAAPAALAPTVAPTVPDVLDDPGVVYTREIQNALIEAMIESSGPLAVADEEWLVVAARDNLPRDPLVPGDTTDFTTMYLRIKGADLSAFHAKRITMEEARKRVRVSDQ